MEQPQTVENIKVAKVAVELAVGKILDYAIPTTLAQKVIVGASVMAPLRGIPRRGIVIGIEDNSSYKKLLPLLEVLTLHPIVPANLLNLAFWMSNYYITPLNQVLKKMLPVSIRENQGEKQAFCVYLAKTKEELRDACPSLREKHPQQARVLEEMLLAQRGIFLSELLEKANVSRSPVDALVRKKLLTLSLAHVDRSPLLNEEYFRSFPKKLNSEQQDALDAIHSSLASPLFKTHLLYGVTGSGKTEIYLQAIEKALLEGKGAIVLVPEISLTTQTIEKFKSRFDTQIAILHHRLSGGQRYDEWHRIFTGEARIVIGARSALFSPVQNLGLIIVDEEHDSAYKQSEEPPCYQARDVAVMRGKLQNCVVVLGTATPSLESYSNALKGRYILNRLKNRVGQAIIPQVHIIDMKKESEKAGQFTLFSQKLLDSIKDRFAKGEQTILFLNRRGYHTSFLCQRCGYIFACPHCEKTLTFHYQEHALSCHLCGYQKKPIPKECEKCRSQEMLKYRGVGTENVEKRLNALFPEIRTLRIDGDTTRHKGSHERLIRLFSTGKSDVLIGTQMITKGLHFPSVTLVAILSCDSTLQIPDFRSSENTFQLITQVAGRAGRGDLLGEVILQTHMPENPTIQIAAEQNFDLFYSTEMESRKIFNFPPLCRFIKFTFSGLDQTKTVESARAFQKKLQEALPAKFTLHPLQPCGHPKIKDLYRFQFLIRGEQIHSISPLVEKVKREFFFPTGIKLLIDVDPNSTFF